MANGMCSDCGRSGRLTRGLCHRDYRRMRRRELVEVREYVRIFLETYGPFPHPCHWCQGVIPEYGGVFQMGAIIHHLDHDHGNNDPGNLAVGHRKCHVEHHGSDVTDEQRAKMSAFQKVHQNRPEVRLRNSEAQKRIQKEVQNRPEVKAKVSAAATRQHAADREPTPCPDCGRSCVGRHGLAVHRAYMHRHATAPA